MMKICPSSRRCSGSLDFILSPLESSNTNLPAARERLIASDFCSKDSPDLKAAREVADFLKTVHHEYTFTVQEGIDALSDVVYHLETYDVTTIRASTPMFLLSRRIKSMGVKMVLSGEGSDELLGGETCSLS